MLRHADPVAARNPGRRRVLPGFQQRIAVRAGDRRLADAAAQAAVSLRQRVTGRTELRRQGRPRPVISPVKSARAGLVDRVVALLRCAGFLVPIGVAARHHLAERTGRLGSGLGHRVIVRDRVILVQVAGDVVAHRRGGHGIIAGLHQAERRGGAADVPPPTTSPPTLWRTGPLFFPKSP